MNTDCDVCQFVQNPTHQILVTPHWSVGLGPNQAYLGRAYVTLLTHKSSLAELTDVQWQEFTAIVTKLETVYRDVFKAAPLNWGCFMNNAFRDDPPHPHVHWHVFPRYKRTPEFAGQVFADPLYGEHYDPAAEHMVDEATMAALVDLLKPRLQ